MAVMNWDDKAQLTSTEYTLFEPGSYAFKVESFERTVVKSGKNVGKPQADYTLKIMRTDGASTTAHYRLILDTDYMWKISGFFKALGMVPAGVSVNSDFVPDWEGAIGNMAMCEVTQREYTKQDGSKAKTNDVSRVWQDAAEAANTVYGTL